MSLHPAGRIALLALLVASLHAQAPERGPLPPAPADTRRVHETFFQVDLPETWRRMTPNEGIALRKRQLPFEMQVVQSNRLEVFGDVDRWLASGFDGRALQVVLSTPELTIDQVHLDAVVDHWNTWKGDDGGTRQVLAAEIGTVGVDRQPALCLQLRLVPGDGTPASRALEFYTSTSGQQLILSFRAWENDWQLAEPELRRMAGSLIFPTPPKRPEELGGRLLQAALLGGCVAFILLAIRHLRAANRSPN